MVENSVVCVWCRSVVFAGTDQSIDFFVGDVSSYTLHNLQPGTTYDVKVIAQYTGGMSAPLTGQGTTRTYSNSVKMQMQESKHIWLFVPLRWHLFMQIGLTWLLWDLTYLRLQKDFIVLETWLSEQWD